MPRRVPSGAVGYTGKDRTGQDRIEEDREMEHISHIISTEIQLTWIGDVREVDDFKQSTVRALHY